MKVTGTSEIPTPLVSLTYARVNRVSNVPLNADKSLNTKVSGISSNCNREICCDSAT